ncbi:protein kinase [Candidatus Poribacteria bacterium]|nr:protein kinase [Candidatus Poribacteria bacterium]
MAVEVLCPQCGASVPVPRFRREGGEAKVRCRICGTLLSIHRPSRDARKTDQAVNLGETITVPGYEILGVLGKGGMGLVFSAVRQSDQQLVAIKVLPPECAAYPELVQRFDMEAQMMAALCHPNIVQILDRGRVGEHYFIVLDYVPGCTLKDRISKAAPLGIDEVVAIMTPVAEAIQACHDAGLVHRDLKPANILLSQDGRVNVTDFGIANLIQRLGDQTENGVIIGTPQYVAPEQLRDGSNVDVRADQYSLAVIIYEMLTGVLPMGVFEPPSGICRDLTAQAEATLLKALSRDPAKRYDSIRQFTRTFRRSLHRPAEGPSAESLVKTAAIAASASKFIADQRSSTEVRVSVLNDSWSDEHAEKESATPRRKTPVRGAGPPPTPFPDEERPIVAAKPMHVPQPDLDTDPVPRHAVRSRPEPQPDQPTEPITPPWRRPAAEVPAGLKMNMLLLGGAVTLVLLLALALVLLLSRSG